MALTTDLKGQVAIVTGSAVSIGQSIAQTLARAGASIVLVDIADCSATAEMCGAAGVEAVVVRGSVTSDEDMQRMAREAVARFGRIDILVNNAGGTSGLGIGRRPLEEFPEADWDRVVELNLKGPFLATRAVVPTMKQQRSGKIVFISSGAGRSSGRSHVFPYSAAKAGVLGLMREVAHEMGKYGVTANAIAPGLILANDRLRKTWADMGDERRNEFLGTVPMGRTGVASDIADAVLFLCTDASRYVTGQTICVDGGRWMF